MNRHLRPTASWTLAAALLCLPCLGLAKDKTDAGMTAGAGEAKSVKDKSSGSKDASASAARTAKLYRFKGEKKSTGSGNQPMALLVEDVFTGKADTLQVPDDDPATKEYAPLVSVAAVVAELEPGAVISVETEKQKGRTVLSSVSKAEYKPGEETPNGFVFVSTDAVSKGGVENVVVTLSKFGREVKAGVPMRRDDDVRDAKWEPDPKIDYVVRRLKPGDVVEALIKPGKTPMIAELYEFRPPERGKFVGLKEVQFNSWPAAGFEIAGEDGVPVTFTLDGTEQSRNGKTQYAPYPAQLAAVRKLRAGTPIEVHYRVDGTTWMLRRINLLPPGAKLTKPPGSGTPATPEPDAKPDKGGGKTEPEPPDMRNGDAPGEKPGKPAGGKAKPGQN